MTEPALRLGLTELLVTQGLKYQILSIELVTGDRLIDPQDLYGLELPPGINTTGGVVISGRAPMWLYAYLTHELHPTAWVACYDPRIGAVVVATHSRLVQIGQVVAIAPPDEIPPENHLCPAIMIVGPPDSGKSVFAHALFQSLLWEYPDIYLQRAHWDGEGNYTLEMGENATEDQLEAFKLRNRGTLTDRFFPYQAQAILQLRRQKSLVIVDVGGMVQPQKLPVLEACTHYLIISSQPEAVDNWHDFCSDRANLIPIAVIISTLTDVEIVHQCESYIEMTCGAWIRGKARAVPKVLLERVKKLISSNQ